MKRYAVGTEPVREAAKVRISVLAGLEWIIMFVPVKFWTSFYEQAAQIRIPTFDDYSTVNENTSEHQDTEAGSQDHEEHADTTARYQTSHIDVEEYEANTVSTVNSETSFLPGQGAVSSTPAMSRAAVSKANRTSERPSWMLSSESPLVRLNREINELSLDTADTSIFTPQSVVHRATLDRNTSVNSTFQQEPSIIPPSEKGKGKDTAHPLLHNVLRHNLYSTSDNSSFDSLKVSPLKFRSKPKTPIIDKTRNPYLPEQATPTDWSGVVDLRDPSILTPKRKGKSINLTTATPYDDDDDSFDGLPPGMSPPVLMSPARPPRSSAELGLLKLGPTPARDATTRIQRDLIRDAQIHSGGSRSSMQKGKQSYYESSTSTAMTPPSLSRYNRAHKYSTDSMTEDSSLESMIRHIRNDARPGANAAPVMSTPDLPRQQTYQSAYSPGLSEPATPVYEQLHPNQDDLDSDSDSLDVDDVNNTAHPSAAFLMASQGVQYTDDNSFGSSNNSSDSLADEDVATATGIVPIHPFAQSGAVVEDDGFDDDDSYSDDGFETRAGPIVASSEYEDETLFGVAPARRMLAPTGHLRMLGEDLLQDTIGIGSHIAASGRQVDESPTPNVWVPR